MPIKPGAVHGDEFTDAEAVVRAKDRPGRGQVGGGHPPDL